MGILYGRAGRLTAQNGGFWPGQWVKPYSDMRPRISAEQAERMSPQLRYLLGFSAHAPLFR
jgi:hypothetical protein